MRVLTSVRRLLKTRPEPFRSTVQGIIDLRLDRRLDQAEFEHQLDLARAIASLEATPRFYPFPSGDDAVLRYALIRAEIEEEWRARRDPKMENPPFLKGAALDARRQGLHGRERYEQWLERAFADLRSLAEVYERISYIDAEAERGVASDLRHLLTELVRRYTVALACRRIPWIPRARSNSHGTILDEIEEKLR